MKRLRGGLFAYPADDETHRDDVIFNVTDANIKGCYSKLLLANAENILDIIDKEATELEVQMAQDENCPEKCFIEEAVRLLDRRRGVVLAGGAGEVKIDGNGSGSAGVDGGETSAAAPKYFYFYQAADGQHLYLHAINARMLEHTYGSLEFGPKTITGKSWCGGRFWFKSVCCRKNFGEGRWFHDGGAPKQAALPTTSTGDLPVRGGGNPFNRARRQQRYAGPFQGPDRHEDEATPAQGQGGEEA